MVLTERFEPAWVCFGYAQAPVIEALRAYSTPEEYAAWERRLRAFYNGVRLLPERLHAHVSGAWRDELIEIVRARTDPTQPRLATLSLLDRDQQRTFVRHALASGTPTPSRTEFVRRLEHDHAFEEALLAWSPRPSNAWKRSSLPLEPLPMLLDAAVDNNAAAIEALCRWGDADEVIAVPQFSLGLAPDLVRALLARSKHAPRLSEELIQCSQTFIANASPQTRERWRRERGFRSREERGAEPDRERRWRSLANEDDADAIVSGASWRERGAEAAYRALIRCVALRLAPDPNDAPLREVQRTLLERVASGNFEDWEAAIVVAINDTFDRTVDLDRARLETAIGRVLRARPDATMYVTDAMLCDCRQLEVADAVIAIVAESPWVRGRAEGLCALIPLASDASRAEAIAVMRASFRESSDLPAFEAMVPHLTVDDVLVRWTSIAGPTSLGLIDAALLTTVGGAELVDQAGDLLVELLSAAGLQQ